MDMIRRNFESMDKKVMKTLYILFIVGIMLLAGPAKSLPITFSQVIGDFSAEVIFQINGDGDLEVILTNTSTADVLVPVDVLTGVLFDIAGDPILTRLSALLHDGSVVLFAENDFEAALDEIVGGEWAYTTGLDATPFSSATQGIGSAGMGLFGDPDTFPGPDLQPPPNVDGLQYGLTSAGDDPDTGNTPVTAAGQNNLIQNSVIFTLGLLPDGFDPFTDISNPYFLYGTSLGESPTVPEPSTLLLLVSGVAGVVASHKMRKQKQST